MKINLAWDMFEKSNKYYLRVWRHHHKTELKHETSRTTHIYFSDTVWYREKNAGLEIMQHGPGSFLQKPEV